MFQWIKNKLWKIKADRWLKQGKAQTIGVNCIVGPDRHIYKHDIRKYCEFTSVPIEIGKMDKYYRRIYLANKNSNQTLI